MTNSAIFLGVAAAVCVVASVLHFACIPWGAEGYRRLGAGEVVTAAVKAGDWRPHVSAVVIGTMLLVWAWYALAGAGLVDALPLQRPVLLFIGGGLVFRAIAFPILRPIFPGNTPLFWWISSAIVGMLGLLFLLGVATSQM